MDSLRRRKEESWNLLGAIGWPEDVGSALGAPGGAALTYADYVASLAPLLWLRLRETSGTTAANSGSLGAAQNGVNTDVTVGQTGQLGANEAADLNGTTSKIQVPATASLNLNAWTYACLVKADTAGESSQGNFFAYDVAGNFAAKFNSALTALRCAWGTGTFSVSVTTTGLTAGTWAWVFFTFDFAGDKKIRIYTGVAGVLAEKAYSSQTDTAAVPTLTGQSLIVGNTSNQVFTFDGLYDEFLVKDRVLTTGEMTQIVTLSGA